MDSTNRNKKISLKDFEEEDTLVNKPTRKKAIKKLKSKMTQEEFNKIPIVDGIKHLPRGKKIDYREINIPEGAWEFLYKISPPGKGSLLSDSMLKEMFPLYFKKYVLGGN